MDSRIGLSFVSFDAVFFFLQYEKMRDWELVRKEQVNAARLVKRLEQLLYEMDNLRAQVQDEDIAKFDKLTATARAGTITAIKEYLGKVRAWTMQ